MVMDLKTLPYFSPLCRLSDDCEVPYGEAAHLEPGQFRPICCWDAVVEPVLVGQ
jgi:hypothetical protein